MSKRLNTKPGETVAPLSDEAATKPAFTLTAGEMIHYIKHAVRDVVAESRATAEASTTTAWLTVAQACELLGKSDRWLLQQLRMGAIEGRKVGSAWRVSREEIERVLREGLREV